MWTAPTQESLTISPTESGRDGDELEPWESLKNTEKLCSRQLLISPKSLLLVEPPTAQ